MDKTTQKCQDIMKRKLAWMQYAILKIKELKDQKIIEFYFWGYISAFYAITQYYKQWVSENYPPKSKIYIEHWVNKNLDETGKWYWKIIFDLRQIDQHRKPVITEHFNIPVSLELEGIPGFLFIDQDKKLNTRHEKLFYVQINNSTVVLLMDLCEKGFECINKFVDNFYKS